MTSQEAFDAAVVERARAEIRRSKEVAAQWVRFMAALKANQIKLPDHGVQFWARHR